MTTEELAQLLARITVLDNRQVDRLTLEAWEPIVGHLAYEDALAAVNAHFQTTDQYLLPVHIISGAGVVKRRRFNQASSRVHEHQFDAESGYCGCGIRDDRAA